MIEGLAPGKVDSVMTIEAIRLDDSPRLAPVFRADADERDRCDGGGCGDAEEGRKVVAFGSDRCSPLLDLRRAVSGGFTACFACRSN
jgi:hypothetical protein